MNRILNFMSTLMINPTKMNLTKICLLFFLLAGSLSLFSQEFYGGVLGGFNGSKVRNDRSLGYNKMGLIAGAWVQRDINENFYWGMEIKINQKGSRKVPTKDDPLKYVYRLNYIDLPVLFGYQYKPYISFFAGLSYGYLFNKNSYDVYGFDPLAEYTNISNWELGMFAGIKVDFDQLVKKEWARKFMLETRFQNSVLSIDKSHEFFTYYLAIGQYNNVISTVLYYRIEWRNKN